MTKVFMIDDGYDKQYWFTKVLERANQLMRDAGSGARFEAGFGVDPFGAADKVLNPNDLWEALQHSDAFYFVDMQLNHSGTDFEQPFTDFFKSADNPAYGQAYAKFDTAPLAEVKEKHQVAVLCLFALREIGASAVLASTLAPAGIVERVYAQKLALRPQTTFPDQHVGDSTKQEWHPPDPIGETTDAIEVWARLLCSLRNPLEQVKDDTKRWCAKQWVPNWMFGDDGLPHGMPQPTSFDDNFVAGHKACVRKVWPGAPDSWWGSYESVEALNECIKETVGSHAQWMASGKRGLCLAGAYLMLLLVLAEVDEPIPATCYIQDFQSFCKRNAATGFLEPIEFIPTSSSNEAAFAAVRALFDFFRAIGINKYDLSKRTVSAIEAPKSLPQAFRVFLNWEGKDFKEFARQANEKILAALNEGQVCIETGNATSAFVRFLLASQIRSDGIGAIGGLAFVHRQVADKGEKDWLRVGAP